MVWLLLQYLRLVRAGGGARQGLRGGIGGAGALQPPSPVPVRDPAPPRQRGATERDAGEADGAPPKRQRRHDGQLRLPAWMAGDGGGDERPPFGDG